MQRQLGEYIPSCLFYYKEERIMSKWLYDPEMDSRNGKEFEYNSPIHENDTLFNGFTYVRCI